MGTEKTESNEHDLTEGGDGSATITFRDDTGVQQTGNDAGQGADANRTAGADDLDNDLDNDPDDDGRNDDGQGASGARNEEEEISPERAALRAQRRNDRASRRERRRTAQNELYEQLHARDIIIDELRQRVEVLSRRSSGNELAAIDSRIRQGEDEVSQLQGIIADAVAAQDGATVADATARMTRTQAGISELQNHRKDYVERARRASGAAAPADPRVVANAQSWAERNQWYDPTGRDPDSQLVMAIDNQLAAEGLSPQTPAYWAELQRRVDRVIPPARRRLQRSQPAGDNSDYDDNRTTTPSERRPRNVVTGSGRQGAAQGSGAGRQITLSPARVQALKDAGLWDDPKKRAEAVRRYVDYDAQQAANGSR